MLVTDGVYGSMELRERAQRQNVVLVTTALNEKNVNPLIHQFTCDKVGRIERCPFGHAPYQTKMSPNGDECAARFGKQD